MILQGHRGVRNCLALLCDTRRQPSMPEKGALRKQSMWVHLLPVTCC